MLKMQDVFPQREMTLGKRLKGGSCPSGLCVRSSLDHGLEAEVRLVWPRQEVVRPGQGRS